MKPSILVIPVLLLAGALVADSAVAAKKKKKAGAPRPGDAACDLSVFPLVAGNRWTFTSGADEIEIKVRSVGPGQDEQGKPVTEIKVEETFKGASSTSVWTCTKESGLRVSPDSFLFTGEPGARNGLEVTWTKHEDVWLHPEAHLVTGSGWTEKLAGDVKRSDLGGDGATHPDAKLEIERYATVGAVEEIEGPFFQGKAQLIEVQLRGRAILGEEKVEILIDDKNPGGVWLVNELGPVRVKDNLKQGKTWELTGTTLAIPK